MRLSRNARKKWHFFRLKHGSQHIETKRNQERANIAPLWERIASHGPAADGKFFYPRIFQQIAVFAAPIHLIFEWSTRI